MEDEKLTKNFFLTSKPLEEMARRAQKNTK